jgi:Fe-Mn family superoxide dismutase
MIELPDLPYGYDALSPVISEATLRIHHGKHHAKYVAVVNEMIGSGALADAALETILLVAQREDHRGLLNNAGQAWNHGFFWASMSPTPQAPTGNLADRLASSFGDLAAFRSAFVTAGTQHFGSGWVWLLQRGDALSVACTHDGESVVTGDATPLLVCDLWEHAYYLDHQNDRAGFLAAWFDHLADWSFAADQVDRASRQTVPSWTYPSSRPISGHDSPLPLQLQELDRHLDRAQQEAGLKTPEDGGHWSPSLFG